MPLSDLQYANSEPSVSADYKVKPEDFRVKEVLSFEPSGQGDHLFLLIEKTGLSTQELHEKLVAYFKCPNKDVSYSGMKDKQAVTQQWFSIKFNSHNSPDVEGFLSEDYKVLKTIKNSRKLKRGSHHSNSFTIRLRNLSENPKTLVERLESIKVEGVPNYFGEQRFGNDGDNVRKAKQLFSGAIKVQNRYLRSLYFSAARGWLFNKCLSKRIELGNWNQYLEGDVMSLEGTSSSFAPDVWDQVLVARLAAKDIHPSGPLWGNGNPKTSRLCAELEQELVGVERDLKKGLEESGLEIGRRALRSMVKDLIYTFEDDETLLLEFSLNKGAYATAVLRELVKAKPVNKSTIRHLNNQASSRFKTEESVLE